MKKVCIVILVIALSLLIGCGSDGITPESLTVNAGDYSVDLGVDNGLDGRELAELQEAGVGIMKTRGQVDGNISISGDDAMLACGLKVGDDVDKVIKTLGNNKTYDDEGDGAKYVLTYYYYMNNGKMLGVSDRINHNHLVRMQMDEAEMAAFEEIREDSMSSDNYLASFYIADGKVDRIQLSHTGMK